jgi:serine/threonine-protein kinase
MDSYSAIAKLSALGFKVNPKQAYNDATSGIVFDQDPTGNDKALKGATVTIWVSKGPAPKPVPDVVGKSYAEAYSKLKGNGFKHVVPQYVVSTEIKGTVTAEDPPAYSRQTPDTTITLTVSTGPQLLTVPPVTGEDVDTATAQLKNQNFKVKVVLQDTFNIDEGGVVISQYPTGNSQALPRSTVIIYVGNYVDTTTTTP